MHQTPAFLLVALAGAALASEPQSLKLTDHTGRGFPPDLVNYTIDAGLMPRVVDADGKPVPAQVTPGAEGKATLSFVAAVAPKSNATFVVRKDGPPAPPAVSTTKDGDALVLANQQVAVKVPGPREKRFDKPVPADTLPAPILSFRGPDGSSTPLRAGPWKGEGKLLLKRPVKAFTVAQTANGPVFTEVRYRLDYAEGGFYEAMVRVTDRVPFAQVSEAYDLGKDADTDFWQLDLAKGWQPDAAEHMNVAGQGFTPVVYPSLADEEKANATGPNVGASFTGGGDKPQYSIHHDSCWGSRYVSYYGIHNAAARKADPNGYPVAMVAPLHKGDWRRSPSLPVHIKAGSVAVRFPMATWPASWQNEPRSDVSPFSCHEHDPSLPVTYGRRVWGLVLAPPALKVTGYGDKSTADGIGYSVRVLYGEVGLDRYKDFILSWPDAKPAYPRVFITPAEAQKYRDAVRADPGFPLLPMLKDYYWFTGDAALASKEAEAVVNRLSANISYILTSLSIHHHHTLEQYGTPIGHTESVLSWPDLPAATREAIRARLALLCYLLVDPDVTSAGNGSHHGNPNMGVSRLSDRSNLAALIPDHPMHKAWSDYMGGFLAYKQGSFMAPEGGWFEYGASYHMHGYGKILRGMMGALADKVPEAGQIYAYHRQDFDYYLNLLTPFDSRYGSRTIPGSANSPVGSPPHYLQAMGSVADRDPEFAANLRWAWDNSGRMIGTGGDAITLPAMARPEIPAKEPKLTSRIYPGYGVIFRAHQGADETCLYLRSGYLWSHWNQDQGNLMLYAKGAVLLPSQPFGYGGPKDKNFPDKNFIRFGDPGNDLPHDWADSNILDAQFTPSVDYAWASIGYPDWFINPGYRPRFGEPRKLVAGKEGAFTWDRQVLFLKGATGKSPNYFVVRDSMNPSALSTSSGQAGSRLREDATAGQVGQAGGQLASWFNLSLLGRKTNVTVAGSTVALDTEWPTKLDLLFTGRDKLEFEMLEDDLPLQLGSYNKPTGTSRDWIAGNTKEQHVALRLANAPGQEVAWVLYPRGAGETAPTATQLAPGVTKIVTGEGTDYVFLSTTPFTYTVEGVTFDGMAGAVRVPKGGKPALVFSRGGKPKTEPRVVADGNTVRFVATDPVYVKLVSGNVGVRGVGPFDLTFTPDGITGTVDGDIRTIVTTWPANITRPGYTMDGVRWYAGFADEQSIYRGTPAPQFAIAMGVSAGKHDVKISEWEWPAMPTPPARTVLAIK